MIAEDDLITSTLLPAAPTAPQWWANRPLGATWVFCGIKIFRIAHGKIVERRRPERSLGLAPDRRLADLELGGADRAALAQCAEFGQ